MALALLGTVLPAGIRLTHAACVAKSWPTFWDWLARVAQVERAPA
jgi:5-enolpyruvylshikimate-3-phosphate synthase